MAKSQETALVTVAGIRATNKQHTEYFFNERQRIFRLADGAADDQTSLKLLRGSQRSGRPVKVSLSLRRDLIQRVSEPSNKELEEFSRTRILLENPDRIVKIDVSKIDPTSFNFVDLYQKWRCFRLCTRIIPSYAKAKQIFDFCAQLSCHLPGPYSVNPCIPFQYVRDGCYARAHQMRRIITTRYGYCCEKVFSFGYLGNDQLAVRADKWGGCCVRWWYHVAPLVRVKFRIKRFPKINLVLAMVIDPSMFDKPVLLSTWLSAQEHAPCAEPGRVANVSSYSIQPGSAYSPAYPPVSFSTDPNYVATQSTLIGYSGLTTCP